MKMWNYFPGMFGSSAASFGGGFLGQGIGSGSFMNPGSMANAMGMGAMSYYGPYSNTYSSAAAAAQSPGFSASPYAHGFPMPNPSYPYAGYRQSVSLFPIPRPRFNVIFLLQSNT